MMVMSMMMMMSRMIMMSMMMMMLMMMMRPVVLVSHHHHHHHHPQRLIRSHFGSSHLGANHPQRCQLKTRAIALPPEGEQAMASGSGGSAAPKAAAAEGPASGGPEAGPASGGPEAGPASGGLTDTVWRAALAAAMTHTLEFGSPPDLERWSEAQLAALLRDPEPPALGRPRRAVAALKKRL